ncbi:FkbM family methyltransferase [Nitratireductor sp. XY-223]|uniref:FkbM family methyltransferase n=1 Tax=Nitratireductor sp. XY-223 TaxID=2561926 RepID=UPI00145A1F6A|nr:FkbM family methyltransferase [Nitratireductor sp. XY-223]
MNIRTATRRHRYLLGRYFRDYVIPGHRRRRAMRVFFGKSFSLGDIDKRLMAFLSADGGYFIELGANDGVSQSNTYLLEARHGWRGLLVEAVPHLYMQCKHNRSPQNDYCHAAAVDFDYPGRFVEMHYSGLMTVGETSALDIEHHARDGVEFLGDGEEVIRFGAPARTLTSILDEVEAPRRIDFVSLDVEGAELSVLGGIDFERYSFGFLLIETGDFDGVAAMLAKKGYGLVQVFSAHDYLFAPGA